MVGVSRVTIKGQVTVPETVRAYLEITAGDHLYFEVEPKEKVVKIRRMPKSVVEELAGSLRSSVRYMDILTARQKAGEALVKKYEAKRG